MILRSFWQCDATIRRLLLASFFFNLAFYMLVPFLVWHLSENLLISAASVGAVMAVRSFSQQGLFVVGGLLTDRFGCRWPILFGCGLRAVGFVLFAVANNLPGVLVAALLTGISGALFTPAAQLLFSRQRALQGSRMFALASVFRSAGELVGPLVGLLLIQLHFSVVSLTAALPFALFAVVFYRGLSSPTVGTPTGDRILSHLIPVLKNRAFIVFCGLMGGYFVLIAQLSFALPMELHRRGGDETWLAALFFISALLGVSLQLKLTQWGERLGSPAHNICYGMVFMACAFALLVVDPPRHAIPLGLLIVLSSAVLLTVGMLLAYPVIMHQVSHYSADRSTATHFGVFYLFAGCGMALGSLLVGWAWPPDALQAPTAIWWVLCVIALTVSVGIVLQDWYCQQKFAIGVKS